MCTYMYLEYSYHICNLKVCAYKCTYVHAYLYYSTKMYHFRASVIKALLLRNACTYKCTCVYSCTYIQCCHFMFLFLQAYDLSRSATCLGKVHGGLPGVDLHNEALFQPISLLAKSIQELPTKMSPLIN
jgi:hypothetical protein